MPSSSASKPSSSQDQPDGSSGSNPLSLVVGDVTYHLGSGSAPVLVSSVRTASSEGFCAVEEASTVSIEGSRLIYRVDPSSGGWELVGVLARGQDLTPRIAAELDASRSLPAGHVRKSDVVGYVEIAKRMRAKVSTVRKWVADYPSFPKPFAVMGTVNLWDYSEVKRWYRERDARAFRVRPKRPKKDKSSSA